ncbi:MULTISPECIES: WXG100 family type VII secretion target [Streptomyces]|jgi:uncharacterized protein YukE|uniref:WXG100 family type VII secretion target n=1 Tax=Streptomyces TaxID=1883 RepID=UPI0019081C4E|nr:MULTISPECIES: hypothetical protein [unclassified Streptomyces]MCU4750081.1 hypothetical protein [Streptomyces sp. G-5]QQN76901.1 hypothetical protein IPZ77_05170 [Streptomyces sp. XC 2026]
MSEEGTGGGGGVQAGLTVQDLVPDLAEASSAFETLRQKTENVRQESVAVWGGPSGQAFREAQAKAAQRLHEISSSLQVMSDLLNDSLQNLGETELEQLNQMRRVESSIDDAPATPIMY